ncbi:hypothetical protein D3C78_1801070 [compost metagenome]
MVAKLSANRPSSSRRSIGKVVSPAAQSPFAIAAALDSSRRIGAVMKPAMKKDKTPAIASAISP